MPHRLTLHCGEPAMYFRINIFTLTLTEKLETFKQTDYETYFLIIAD